MMDVISDKSMLLEQPISNNIDKLNVIRSFPVTKTYHGDSHIVGLLTFKNKTMDEEEVPDMEKLPDTIYPPFTINLNYSKNKPFEQAEQDKASSLQKSEEISEQFALLENNSPALAFWMDSFLDYMARIEPCCQNNGEFWSDVFKLYPRYDYKWKYPQIIIILIQHRFQSLNFIWLDFMLSYLDFREPLRKWFVINSKNNIRLSENEDGYLKGLKETQDDVSREESVVKELKSLISYYNDLGLNNPGTLEMPPVDKNKLDLEISNGGSLRIFKADPQNKCDIPKAEKLRCNPDVDAPLLKQFVRRIHEKRRYKSKNFQPKFKYTIA